VWTTVLCTSLYRFRAYDRSMRVDLVLVLSLA